MSTLPPDILHLLQRLLPPHQRPADIRPLSGGAVNATFRITLTDGTHRVLRVYAGGTEPLGKEKTLHRLATDLPIPRWIASTTSPRPAALLSFVEGHSPLDHPGPPHLVGHAIGQTLASIGPLKAFPSHGLLDHSLAIRRRFPSLAESLHSFVDWSLTAGAAKDRLSPPTQAAIRAFLHQHLPALDAIDAPPFALVHGDFKPQNLLLSQDSTDTPEVVAVLDWEYAFAGSPLSDLARFLHHSTEHPELQAGLLDGFQRAGGHLPRDWQTITALLSLRDLLGTLNTTRNTPHLAIATSHLHALLKNPGGPIEDT